MRIPPGLLANVNSLVRVSVLADGSVVSTRVERRSDSSMLDQEFIRAIERSNPLPPLRNDSLLAKSREVGLLLSYPFAGSSSELAPPVSAAAQPSREWVRRAEEALRARVVASAGTTNRTTAVAHVRVAADGGTSSATIAKSSGLDSVDQAVLDALAPPFKLPVIGEAAAAANASVNGVLLACTVGH